MSMEAAVEDPLDEAALEALVRREVEAAFAGMETTLASGDEQAALALIQSQGDEVMNSVLSELEDNGQLLSSKLSARVEELARSKQTEMLKKYDERKNLFFHYYFP